MAKQDLYIDYLSGMQRDELRLMARNQGIVGFSRMDKPELIVKLLDAKIRRANEVVVNQARLLYQGLIEPRLLFQAVAELESLHDALNEWEQRWNATKDQPPSE